MDAQPITDPRSRRLRTRVVAGCVVGLLAAHNATVNTLLPRGVHIPGRLITGAALAGLARVAGMTRDELGLAPSRTRSGVRGGLAAAALVAVGVAAAAATPTGAALLTADRFVGVPAGRAAFDVLVDIPVTAVLEEWAFRGVLLGLLLRIAPPHTAVTASSVVFGLGHILPSVDQLRTAGTTGAPLLGGVVGLVVVTSLAGVVFAWLRLRTGSLLAPTIAHAAVNGSGYTAGWLLTQG